jgi:S-formylglutathione hydrolase FrmB
LQGHGAALREAGQDDALVRDAAGVFARHQGFDLGLRGAQAGFVFLAAEVGDLRLALRHAELFSAAALMSPAIYAPFPPKDSAARMVPAFQTGGVFDPQLWSAQNWPALLDGFAQSRFAVRLHLSSGAQDHFHADRAARAFFAAWQERGWSGELHVEPGQHDFPFWRRIAPGALRFLLNPPRLMASARGRS